MTNNIEDEKAKDSIGTTAIWAVVVVAAFWVVWFFGARAVAWFLGLGSTVEKAGALGDSFGAINTLFTGLAMVGAAGSFAYQQRAILDQQRAQKEQQREITLQRKQFTDTHVERLKSRFEQSFFELLALSRELRTKISFKHSQDFKIFTALAGPLEQQKGDAAFEDMRTEIKNLWPKAIGEITRSPDEHPVGTYYSGRVHAYNENQLGPYFRIIYTMLRRISEATFLEEAEKISYGNLLRSQLTSTELFVIGVNGLANISGDLDRYLVEFRMFKYLSLEDKQLFLEEWKALGETYPEIAFEGRSVVDV